ncbi:MAG: glutaredoxin 3 [Gammaproteobacteria bacterium]|nr:glutaredoxin 3 [Gammaproteobacteria bacterium]
MKKVMMYTNGMCPFCLMAKRIFDDLRVPYNEVRIDLNPKKRQEMVQASRRRTVPQVFIGDRHVGGCDDTQAALRSGQLEIWLKELGIYV